MARYENLDVNRLNVTKVQMGTGSGSVDCLPIAYLKGGNISVSSNATVATQTVNALTIPADTLVLDVYTVIVTSANATCTATVGDGTAASGWDASVNLAAAAGTRTASVRGTDSLAVGKLYSSSDTIDLTYTFSATNTTATYRVDAVVARF